MFIIGLVDHSKGGNISSPPFEWKKGSLLQYLASQTNSGRSKKIIKFIITYDLI